MGHEIGGEVFNLFGEVLLAEGDASSSDTQREVGGGVAGPDLEGR